MNRRFQLIKVSSRAALMALALAWLLPDTATAQKVCEPCFSMPYFKLGGVSTGKVKNSNFQFTASVGQTEINLLTTNNSSNSMATGFWSFNMAEPHPPRVSVSRGDFQDHILVSWEIVDDKVGPPVTGNNVLLYRNGAVLTNLPINQTQYKDFNVFPGEHYEYAVEVSNRLGGSHLKDEIGFLNPNGSLTGTIETRNGNPVPDVKVVLTPNLGRSAHLEVDDYIYFPQMFEGLERSYSIEGWFRSRDNVAQTLFAAVDSSTTREFVRIQLTDQGQLSWAHRGKTSATADVLTTPVSFTDDAEWHHFAAVMADSNNTTTLYVDGRVVGRGTVQDTIGTHRTQIAMGKLSANQHEQYYQGRFDDWRIWSVPKSRQDIRRDMDRTLEGDEGGLAAYWKFDEVQGDRIFDLTTHDNDGIICGIERSQLIAPVFVSGVTDTLGRYAIKGIFYGSGTTFTATPHKTTPIGRSVKFDGVDDYVAFPRQRVDLTAGYTYEGWFKTPGAQLVNPDGQPLYTLFAAVDPTSGANHLRLGMLNNGQLQVSHLGAQITTPERFDTEFWYHYAVTHDTTSGQVILYIDGEVVGTANGAAIDALSEFTLARQSPNIAGQYYKGHLDEIRLWNRARTLEQINAVRNQVLKGDETGMTVYWKINEGDGLLLTDATGNARTGELHNGVKWTEDIPLNEVFTHTFDPESRQATLNPSNTSVDRVDFTDISQIAVSGFFKYSSTTCFIEQAEVLVNGESLVPPAFTDENGRFIVEFEPGAKRQQISVSYRNHEVLPPFIELPRITVPITGLFFEDAVKRTFNGKVAGGVCEFPIAPSDGQIEVDLTTVDGCFSTSVVPDLNSGQFSFNNLPPLIYQTSVFHPDPDIDAFFNADTLSLEQGNGERKYIYRSVPEVSISNFPQHGCGLRVMEMADEYDLLIDVFETYTSQGQAQSCATDVGSLNIFDQIGDRGAVELPFTNGQATYRVVGGFPNIVDGGDHPYQKNIQVTATDTLGRNAVTEEWTYVTGNRPREVDFATTTPEVPFLILHDPPGDGSIAFVEQDSTIETSVSFGYNTGTEENSFITAHLGPDIEFSTGLGFSKTTAIDITADFTAEFNMKRSQSTTKEQTWSFTATETFSTAGGGDVYIGGAMNLLYGITDVLEVNAGACQAQVRPDLLIIPGDFSTTFIYSEGFIVDSVIPELEFLGDTASANRWQSFIDNNNAQKQAAAFSRNISFDAGSQFEFSETNEVTGSATQEIEVVIDDALAFVIGATVDGVGAEGGVKVTLSKTQGRSQATTKTSTNTVGFVLADDDEGDNFSVNIKNDPVYGTPVFETVSGVSSCPWEPGTVAVDAPQLSISPAQQVDIPPEEAAVFNLNIGNISEAERDRTYDLRVLNETNPDGAEIAVNGVLIEDALSFFVPFGQSVQAVMSVFRGPQEYNYENIQMQVFSPCEADPLRSTVAGGLGGTLFRFDEKPFSVQYQVPCSEVAISVPEPNWLITSADQVEELTVILAGYDRLDENLEHLVLQYRPGTGGDWFEAAKIPKANLIDDFVIIPWGINPSVIPDNQYELRAVASCGLALVPGVSPTVRGRIDREAPRVLGLPEPSDGILHPDDQIAIRFNEPINCEAINIGAGHITLTNAVTGNLVDFNHTCGGNEVVIDPNAQNAFLENQTLRVSVGPVEDLVGNAQIPADKQEWELFVNRNPIEWTGLDVRDIVIFEDEDFSTTRTLVNNGGSNRSYNLTDLPSWLDVSPREGTILPGEATTITFAVDGPKVGSGSFTKTIFASGTQGNEPRLVDVRVLCHPPNWGTVDPTDFQHSMNFTAKLHTDSEVSSDNFDRVGVFIDEQLHGVGQVKHIREFENLANTHPYEVFLTVYGNDNALGRDLEFRVWDASECRELGFVVEDYTFQTNAALGTPTNPVDITATSQIIGNVDFKDGWNWFSLNLLADDMTTNGVLGGTNPTNKDIVRNQRLFSQFVNGAGWLGNLETLTNQSMYLINLAQPTSLEIIGFAVDVELTHIAVERGWNWISFLPQQSQAVNEALASLNSVTGDIIKSQFEFAQFVEGIGWIGSLTFMNPSLGYQHFAQEAGTLAYPFFEGDPPAKAVADPLLAFEDWQIDPRTYRNNMTLVASVEGEGNGVDSDEDVIAAFVGDQCRGVGQTVYVPTLDRYLAFVVVYGDDLDGEPVEFRFFDDDEKVERFIPTEVTFRANESLGTVEQPYVLETRARRLGDRGYIPNTFTLGQSFPNPFNPSTQIGYGLPQDGHVELAIYNVVGQKIRTLVSKVESAGYHYVMWDGRSDESYAVPSGMYFYVMQAEQFRQVKKVMLLK